MNGGLEPRLPLTYSTEDSFYASLKKIKDVIKQNLKHLFYTGPGEKRRDINFGINIKQFLFEPMTQDTRQRIITKITEQVSKYLPFIRIQKIDVLFVDQLGELYINFHYFIINLNQEDVLNIQLKTGK